MCAPIVEERITVRHRSGRKRAKVSVNVRRNLCALWLHRARVRRLRAEDATNCDESRPVRRASQLDDLDSRTGMRCVHHAAPADVDADVPESREEEQVARLHPGSCNAPALVVERVRAVRQFNSQATVRPVDEPGAVEAGGRGASPPIGHADLSDGDRSRALADGRYRDRGDWAMASRRLPGRGCFAGARTGDDDRGKGEQRQGAAGGGRHGGGRTTGRKSDVRSPGPVLKCRILVRKRVLSTPLCARGISHRR